MQSKHERHTSGGNEMKIIRLKQTLLLQLQKLLLFLPKRKNRALSLVVLAVVPLFVLFVGGRVLQNRDLTAKVRAENEKIVQQRDALDAQSKEYLAVLNDEDPEAFRDYVIRIAREQLDLSLPGDQVFIDSSFVQSSQQK